MVALRFIYHFNDLDYHFGTYSWNRKTDFYTGTSKTFKMEPLIKRKYYIIKQISTVPSFHYGMLKYNTMARTYVELIFYFVFFRSKREYSSLSCIWKNMLILIWWVFNTNIFRIFCFFIIIQGRHGWFLVAAVSINPFQYM